MRRISPRIVRTREVVVRTSAVRTMLPYESRLESAKGLAALSRSANVYGQTVTPELFFVGEGYDGSTLWAAEHGPLMTLIGSGSNPTIVDAPTESVRAADAGVQLAKTAAKYFVAADTTKGGFGTDDILLEVWAYPSAGASEWLFGKGVNASGNNAWYCYFSPAFSFQFRDGTASMAGSYGVGTAGSWQHFVLGLDRDHATGAFAIRDGVLSGTSRDPRAVTGGITGGANGLYFNGTPSAAPTSAARVALIAMWHAPNWIDAADKDALTTWAAARRTLALGL